MKDFEGSWSSDTIRRSSAAARKGYEGLGFSVLDEWGITAGRIDNFADRSDGWHFFGTMKSMEVHLLFNMLCNTWLVESGTVKS